MRKEYLVIDVNCTITVHEVSRKEFLSWLDNEIEAFNDGYSSGSDCSFDIIYKDGTADTFTMDDYDGHKVKRTNIVSAVYSNPEDYIVFGNYEINEYGVVTADANKVISDTNIICK